MDGTSARSQYRLAPGRPGDAAVVEVIYAYRCDRAWAPLLLDLLAGEIERQLGWLRPRPPVISADDIRNQLILEVLDLAHTLDLGLVTERVGYRLARRSRRRVQKQLKLETARQAFFDSLDDGNDADTEEEE